MLLTTLSHYRLVVSENRMIRHDSINDDLEHSSGLIGELKTVDENNSFNRVQEMYKCTEQKYKKLLPKAQATNEESQWSNTN
jgi:hypothetical protein